MSFGFKNGFVVEIGTDCIMPVVVVVVVVVMEPDRPLGNSNLGGGIALNLNPELTFPTPTLFVSPDFEVLHPGPLFAADSISSINPSVSSSKTRSSNSSIPSDMMV